MHEQDPFSILGLSPNASVAEIKHAYHRLALQYHPDKVRDEENKKKAQTLFQDLRCAYERVLQQTKERSWHTNTQTQPHDQIFMGHPEGGVFIFVTAPGHETFIFPHVRIFPPEKQSSFVFEFDCQEAPTTSTEPSSLERLLPTLLYPFYLFFGKLKYMCSI